MAAVAGHSGARQFLDIRRRSAALPEGRYIWIHAASAGEANQAVPLAGALRGTFGAQVLLTVFSPSGYAFHKNNPAFDQVLALPLDLPGNAKRFIDEVRPEFAVFIRNELWGNYLRLLNASEIPVFLVNAPEHVLQPKGLLTRRYVANCLNRMTAIFAAEPATVHKLPLSAVAGSTKWEAALDALPEPDPVVTSFLEGSNGVIAGSTWPEDEAILLQWLVTQKDKPVRLVIAPHEVNPARISGLRQKFKRASLYSEINRTGNPSENLSDVLIIDTYRVLASAYPAGKAAYIGGGFGKGIHNTLEAAVCGIPVVFGPKHGKFEEAEELIREGVGFSVNNADEFNAAINQLLFSDDLRSSIRKKLADLHEHHQGISKRIAESIKSKLS